LIKSGTALLTLTGSNSFTGGTTINAGGTIILANDTANGGGLGAGFITFKGGTLSMYSNTSSFNFATYNLVVPAGQTGRLDADARCDLYGTLSGGGSLNFYVPYIRTTLYCDWSAFTGVINVTTDGDGGDLRMGTSYSFPGFPQASVILGSKVQAYYIGTLSQGAGTTIEIGELAGSATSKLMGGSTGGRNFPYRIGDKTPLGGLAVFDGTIQEQSATTTTSFIKTGAGTWMLTGDCTWNGGTIVEQGILKISGTLACVAAVEIQDGATLDLADGVVAGDSVKIASGAALTGSGTIEGDLTNDSTITSGTGGELAVFGDVVNNGTMRLTGGTELYVSGSFVNNGVLDLLTGAGSLPANLVNNGVVIDSSAIKVDDYQKNGSAFTMTIESFSGHSYKLQRSTDLTSASWEDVGLIQTGVTQSDGSPTLLTFADSNATANHWFYRFQITP
jgi:autotransporter-associated beta strand protein